MLRQTIGTLVHQMHDMSFASAGSLLPGFRGTDAEAEASLTASLAVMAAQAAAHATSATTFGFIDGSNKKFDFAASADSTGSGSALGNSVEFDQQAAPEAMQFASPISFSISLLHADNTPGNQFSKGMTPTTVQN